MEATGNYGFLLLYLLHQSGIAVSLVNPKHIKHLPLLLQTQHISTGLSRLKNESLFIFLLFICFLTQFVVKALRIELYTEYSTEKSGQFVHGCFSVVDTLHLVQGVYQLD